MIRSLRVRLAIVALGILVLVLAPGAFLLRGAVHVNSEYNITAPADDGANLAGAAVIANRLEAIGRAVAKSDVRNYDVAIESLVEDVARESKSILWLEATDGSRSYFAPARTPELSVRRVGDLGIEVSWIGVDGTSRNESLLTTMRRFDVPVEDGQAPPTRRWWLGAAPLPAFADVARRASDTRLVENTSTRVIDALITRYFWAIGVLLVAVMTPTLFRLLRPVRELTAAVQRFAAGDRSARVTVRGRDELATLGAAFNAMGDRIGKEEALRNALVADVAHELRTPLANLRGQIEALQDGLLAPDAAALASLHEEVAILARLVDDLQQLADAESGALQLEPAPVTARAALETAAAGFQPAASARGVTLEVDADPSLVARADPVRLGQILRNLGANALTHTPAGGRVRLAAARDGGAVAFTVEDTGSGIAPEHLPHVFERFYRADPSRTRATGGAGLGLAVVRQLVIAHGGTVAAASEPGRGTRMTFTLPAA
jgi:signal transduction histidine kinase